MQALVTARELQGVWQRDWLKSSDHLDTTTRVLWAQAGDLFVDLRVPAERPVIKGSTSLATLSSEQQNALTKAEGFAGRIEVSESICTWHRGINWHGPSAAIDAGRLHVEDTSTLIETGVHDDYCEQWRLSQNPPARAHRVTYNNLHGIVIFTNTHFFFGIGVPVDSLLEQDTATVSQINPFESEYTCGRWNGHEGIAVLSTNPFNEMQQVLSAESGQLKWHHLSFNGCLKTRELCEVMH